MFRFTIRELVLLTALVGTAAGWWCSHNQLRSSFDHLRDLAVRQREALISAQIQVKEMEEDIVETVQMAHDAISGRPLNLERFDGPIECKLLNTVDWAVINEPIPNR